MSGPTGQPPPTLQAARILRVFRQRVTPSLGVPAYNQTFLEDGPMNPLYMLPADEDERKRSEVYQRMMQFVMRGQNYLGPVADILGARLAGLEERQVLDLGTGGGAWAIDLADEFPRVEVIGIDLAPIQPKEVPPNCTFELCDLNERDLPYADESYDVIHARQMHNGIENYEHFVRELGRLLKPGGFVILIEPEYEPVVDGELVSQTQGLTGLSGWTKFWEVYVRCLRKIGVDADVPRRLPEYLARTGTFSTITVRDANIPIGFHSEDPELLSMGQLAWTHLDLLLPACRPMFIHCGIKPEVADRLIQKAQRDLYEPNYPLTYRLHIAYAVKKGRRTSTPPTFFET